jgi:hypothetical protein
MRKRLFWVLVELQGKGLYIRDTFNALIPPSRAARWLRVDDNLPAEYRPLAKPGKPLEYATKVGDVYVSGGKVLHVYKPEGKLSGKEAPLLDGDDWARD